MIPLNEIKSHPGPSTSLKVVGESEENMIHLTPSDNDLNLSQNKRNSQNSRMAVIKATPESVVAALSALADIDFKNFTKRN